MAKKSMMIKQQKEQKYKVREYHRCSICGRPRGYMSKFKLCRICFRKYANMGYIPGVVKSSW